MIKQLNCSIHDHTWTVRWPEDNTKDTHLYRQRKPLRILRVMIDAYLIPTEECRQRPQQSKASVLASLIDNKYVDLYRYANGGPPFGTDPVDSRLNTSEKPYYLGWAVAYKSEDMAYTWEVNYCNVAEDLSCAGVHSEEVSLAESDTGQNVYDDMSPGSAAKRRAADVLALQVAGQGVNADLFITERPYLFTGSRWVKHEGVTVCSPDEAIAVIGHYMRSQGVYAIATPSPNLRITYNHGLYYWVGVRELLPEAWRWHSACVYSSAGNPGTNNGLTALGGSVLTRVSRALRARDEIHTAINLPPNNDTVDEALRALDDTLSLLMGAVDATARVAHRTLGLPADGEYSAAWQNDKWRKQLKAVLGLYGVTAKNTLGRNIVEALRLMRNTVHGAALQGIRLIGDQEPGMLISVPTDHEEAILNAFDALGGRKLWGHQSIIPNRSHLLPGIFIDRMFEYAVLLLNQVMSATPVEELPNLTKPLENHPPARTVPGRVDEFSEWSRLCIRWQLGF